MAETRYESILVEQALSREYAAEMEHALKGMSGLNDIKPLVRDFEKEFARYIGVKNAVAVNSGSDALKMALLAAGVKEKDEVILQALGWLAREDKINYTIKNRRTFVSLVEGELRAFNSVVYHINEQASSNNGSGNGKLKAKK